MDEKKLREHIVNLKRAIDKKEPPSTIVTMLKALEREDAPTEDVLRVSLGGGRGDIFYLRQFLLHIQ